MGCFCVAGQILPLDNNKPNSILAVEQNKQLMSSRAYVSWGFADCSLRICHVDTDRPTVISELTQNVDWNGEVVACAVANEKVVVTGQTNSVSFEEFELVVVTRIILRVNTR